MYVENIWKCDVIFEEKHVNMSGERKLNGSVNYVKGLVQTNCYSNKLQPTTNNVSHDMQ